MAATAQPPPAADSATTGRTAVRKASTTAGVNRPLVLVELKLPNVGLNTLQARAAFITAATDLVETLTVPGHDRQDIWVNILNAPDGGWGLGGTVYTGGDLIAAITATPAHP